MFRLTISPVIEHLFIGNLDALDQHVLQQHNIQAIVSAVGSDVVIGYPKSVNCMRINIDDVETANIEPWLEPCFHFINSNRRIKKNVLVHCHAGVSRSATIVLYYLMKQFNAPLRIAFGHLRERRPIVQPNKGFMRVLSNYSLAKHQSV